MRTIVLAILVATVPAAIAGAASSIPEKSDSVTPAGKSFPVKGAGAGNACAAFGPGFVKLDGSDTCVKIGGALSVGVGGSIGPR